MTLGQGSVSAFAEGGNTGSRRGSACDGSTGHGSARDRAAHRAPDGTPDRAAHRTSHGGPHRAAYRGADRSAGYGSAGHGGTVRDNRADRGPGHRSGWLIEPEVPQTETVQTETETSAQTEASTETPTEETSEKQTETKTETEAGTDTFTYTGSGMKITVKLEKELPQSTEFTVKTVTEKDSPKQWKQAVKQIENVTNEGHRELARARFYQLVFLADGEEVTPEGAMDLQISFDKGLGLGLQEYVQAEAGLFAVGENSAEKIAELTLNGQLNVTEASGQLKGTLLFAAAGVQNRPNDGEAVTVNGLKQGLGEALDYSVVARDYAGDETEDVAAENLSSPDTEEETDTEDETAEEPQAAFHTGGSRPILPEAGKREKLRPCNRGQPLRGRGRDSGGRAAG